MNASPKADASLDATRVAQQDTVLSPRFYTTDFDEIDKTTSLRCAQSGMR